jgi:hypothetical protein
MPLPLVASRHFGQLKALRLGPRNFPRNIFFQVPKAQSLAPGDSARSRGIDAEFLSLKSLLFLTGRVSRRHFNNQTFKFIFWAVDYWLMW